ncbi:hypothetical protein V1504DRAFT_463612 [Lipomyces starkeyi]
MSIYYGDDASPSRSRPLVTAAITMTRGANAPADPATTELSISNQHQRQTRSQANAVSTRELQLYTTLKMAPGSDSEQELYKRALEFLKANEPEGWLDIQLSYSSFEELVEKARKLYGDNKIYPRVEYSCEDSTVTIYTAQSALHAQATNILQRWIDEWSRAELVNHEKQELCRRFSPASGRTYNSLNPNFKGSTKVPDGGLVYEKEHVQTVTVVIEVGVSEAYERLRKDIELWMREFGCRTGILFSLKEEPKFKSPSRRALDAYSTEDVDQFQNTMREVRHSQPFGPYLYNRHRWFGKLQEAFIEVFKRTQNTSRIRRQRYSVVENGQLVLPGNVNLSITIADIFPFGEEDIEGIQSVPVYLQIDTLQKFLGDGAQWTAEERFKNKVRR